MEALREEVMLVVGMGRGRLDVDLGAFRLRDPDRRSGSRRWGEEEGM